MTDQTQSSSKATVGDQPLNRRKLLKVAAATAPLIATLPSGAALARSSNLIGATAGNGQDALGRTLCLDLDSGTYENGVVDLGSPPSGNVTAITDREYYRISLQDGIDPVSEAEMCQKGGQYYYKGGGVQGVKFNGPGIVVSAIAVSSLAGAIYIKEV